MFRLNWSAQGSHTPDVTLKPAVDSSTSTRSLLKQKQQRPRWHLSGIPPAERRRPTAQIAVSPEEKRHSSEPLSSSGPRWSYDWKIESSSHHAETYTRHISQDTLNNIAVYETSTQYMCWQNKPVPEQTPEHRFLLHSQIKESCVQRIIIPLKRHFSHLTHTSIFIKDYDHH